MMSRIKETKVVDIAYKDLKDLSIFTVQLHLLLMLDGKTMDKVKYNNLMLSLKNMKKKARLITRNSKVTKENA